MPITPGSRIYAQTQLSDEDKAALAQALTAPKTDEPPPPEFALGSDNTDYYNYNQDTTQLLAAVGESIRTELVSVGGDLGYSQNEMETFFWGNWTSGGALGFFDNVIQRADRDKAPGPDQYGRNASSDSFNDPQVSTQGSEWYAKTADGYRALVDKMWAWYQQNASFKLPDQSAPASSIGRGRSGPSASDIRNQFDLDQLAESASNIWKGMLLEDAPNARKMARAYVDAIVASGGKKKIDFTEFIRGKAKKTARHAAVYATKPDALSEEQYLQPYFQAAQSVVRPDEAASVAIGGAQFGSDAATFSERLRRTDSATGSSNYINELQGRLSNLNNLFKG